MKDNSIVAALAGIVSLGACAAIHYAAPGGLPPRFEANPHAASGWVLAQQALSLLEPGGQITLITRDTTSFKNPALDIQRDSFAKTIRKAHAAIASVQALELDPLRPVEVPAGDFFELIRTAPAGSVIVSFMGPPLLTDAQRSQLKVIKPRIVAFCPGSIPDQVDLRVLFNQGLLHAAVVSRRNAGPTIVKPRHQLEWFNASFLAVTATNLAVLSTGTIGPPPTAP
jgi:hypothetical protein